jgi:GTPase SAR1 family protein
MTLETLSNFPTIQIHGKTIPLKILATSGQERYPSFFSMLLKDTSGIFYCFNCTVSHSFDNLHHLISDAHNFAHQNVA